MTVPLQQQLGSFWTRQSNSQKITLVVLLVAVAVLVPLFINWATQPTYAVAFSGMSETDAGQVVDKLTASNIPYQLNGTGTILVPQNMVYEVRLQMAKEGLPSSGTVGMEVFSGSTLGMTEFSQKVNYQRALEGELERTIGSLASIQTVRVHIVTPEKTLIVSEQSPTTASVMVSLKPGKSLDQSQVQSITHLVASSIEGLKPEECGRDRLGWHHAGEWVPALTMSQAPLPRPIPAGQPKPPPPWPCKNGWSNCSPRYSAPTAR